jgi:general stress protein 26
MARRSHLLACLPFFVTAMMLSLAGNSFGQASQRDIEVFAKSKTVNIATVRKDGNQSKSTPVWFTTTADHVLLIETGPNSWKAKRIRRGSPAIIWIGSETGPAFVGKAEITKDPELENRIITDYPQKYWEARVGLFQPTKEKFDSEKIVLIKITPVRDLPDGFANQPGTPAPILDQPAATPTK